MKSFQIRPLWVQLSAALALGASALVSSAAEAPSNPPLNPQNLGIMESILSYCGPVDAAAAAQLRAKIDEMLKGRSQEAIARARNSNAYRAGYDSINDFVGKVDKRNAERVCKEPLPSGQ